MGAIYADSASDLDFLLAVQARSTHAQMRPQWVTMMVLSWKG